MHTGSYTHMLPSLGVSEGPCKHQQPPTGFTSTVVSDLVTHATPPCTPASALVAAHGRSKVSPR